MTAGDASLAPGMLVTTSAGNYVWRLLSRAEHQPEWIKNLNDTQWNAVLVFDASCQKQVPCFDTINAGYLAAFDLVRFGRLWSQLHSLHETFNEWLKSYTSDAQP